MTHRIIIFHRRSNSYSGSLTTSAVTTTNVEDKEAQLISQNLSVVANETYNLSASGITHIAETDADTIDKIILGSRMTMILQCLPLLRLPMG